MAPAHEPVVLGIEELTQPALPVVATEQLRDLRGNMAIEIREPSLATLRA